MPGSYVGMGNGGTGCFTTGTDVTLGANLTNALLPGLDFVCGTAWSSSHSGTAGSSLSCKEPEIHSLQHLRHTVPCTLRYRISQCCGQLVELRCHVLSVRRHK